MPTLVDAFYRCHSLRWDGTRGEDTAVANAETAMEILGDRTLVEEISSAVLQDYVLKLKEKGLSPSTINRKLAALKTILRVAQIDGHIPAVPYVKMEREPEPRSRVLTQQEEETLFSLLPEPHANLARFLVDTGCRVKEALRLEWVDVDLDQRYVVLKKTKGGKPRAIPLTERATQAITTPGGAGPFTEISQSVFGHAWSRARKEMGLEGDKEFVPHALRHTCASRLKRKGSETQVVQEWLGHSNMQTTLRYCHLDETSLLKARDLLEVG